MLSLTKIELFLTTEPFCQAHFPDFKFHPFNEFIKTLAKLSFEKTNIFDPYLSATRPSY